MPKTTKRQRRNTSVSVNYNPMFPKGAAHRSDNQKARVQVGDAEVQKMVDEDYELNWGKGVKKHD